MRKKVRRKTSKKSKNKVKDFSKIGWKRLSKEQKEQRRRCLPILRLIRRQKLSFSEACREVDVEPEIAMQHLKSALYKRNGRWRAKKVDKIQREMKIYTKGRIRKIVLTNSKDASTVGKYFADVRRALDTHNERHLDKYLKKVIKDSQRRKFNLEIDWDKILGIESRKERPEEFEIGSGDYF